MYKLGSRGTAVIQIQQLLGINSDGFFGPLTQAAVKRFQTAHKLVSDGIVGANTLRALGMLKPAYDSATDEVDNVSRERIKKLHPTVREQVMRIVIECNRVLSGRAKVRIAQGLRTMEEQAQLYAQGRTKPGKIVTKAKPGQSVHNYGFAVDIVMIVDGKIASYDTKKDWDGDKIADWNECVKVFAAHGWAWGGNWTNFQDMPHFEKIGYNSYLKLSKLPVGPDGYVVV